MSHSDLADILDIDDLEACVERVLEAVRGLREDKAALVVGIAQYAICYIGASVHFADVTDRDAAVTALLELAGTSGKAYAQAMIAEGTIWGQARPAPDSPDTRTFGAL